MLAFAAALVAGALADPASGAIVPKDSADEIAQAIIDDPSTLNLATTDWHERPQTPDPGAPGEVTDAVTSGIGDASLAGFPTSGSTFGLLTTGDPTIADTPNDGQAEGQAVEAQDNGAPRGDTDHDVTVIRIGVDVPATRNCLSLDYRFLSEEFPEFVGSQFSDAFIAELDTTQWSTSGTNISRPGDFATNTGEPVSVNGMGPVSVSAAEAAGTTYDGATQRVTTKTPVTPGPHLVYLSIFDQGDAIYDSAVFLDRLAFITESPSTCKPPEDPATSEPPPPPPTDTDPPETTITKDPPNKLTKHKAKYGFVSDEAGSTFECKIDKKPFKACSSPKKVKHLDEGKHKFQVRAIDAAGNVDPTAAKDRFKTVE